MTDPNQAQDQPTQQAPGAEAPPPVAPPPPAPAVQPVPGQVVCPKCGGANCRRVSFTWWGGAVGPAILKHTKCNNCGATFNGRTGQSNTTGIVIYSVVVGVIGIAIIVAITVAGG